MGGNWDDHERPSSFAFRITTNPNPSECRFGGTLGNVELWLSDCRGELRVVRPC